MEPPLEHFTVMADGHPLAIWARRSTNATRTILFVHGATWSARPDFDLHVPGEQRSILARFAARGYAAYAIDLRGYGATPRDRSGWLTPRRAEADVATALDWIAQQHRTLPRPALLGWSNGALVTHLVAQLHPALISDLVLYGDYWYPGVGRLEDSDVPAVAPRSPNSSQAAASDFITPGSISSEAIAAYVASAIASNPIRAEWRRESEWNLLDAAKIQAPTLVLFGEFDPAAQGDNQQALYARLRTPEKQLVVLRGGDHAALLENTQPDFVDAIIAFLERRRKSP